LLWARRCRWLSVCSWPIRALGVAFDRWDSEVLRQVAVLRSGWLTSLMVAVNTVLVSRWT
jgi:hypothetical protein